MKDQAIWTKLRPSSDREKTEPLNYCFTSELSRSDRLEIAVGFCSYKSLLELERLILQKKIKKVCLILGMYYLMVCLNTCIVWPWGLIEIEKRKESEKYD